MSSVLDMPVLPKNVYNSGEEFTGGELTLDEMIKIVSLMENPPEAAMIRKALRFYEVPRKLKNHQNYKWGTSATLMEMLFHFSLPQNQYELGEMLKIVKGKRRVLEIGSSFGGTLKQLASVMPKGSQLVSVDLAIDDTPKFLNPLPSLKETCRQIGLLGGNVELLIGNSHSPQVVEKVREYGPFDFCFIDGEHTYEGMKADWENYGPMSKIVGFHDIAGVIPGCKQCWDEIKSQGFRTEEFIANDNTPVFGIGIVYREE